MTRIRFGYLRLTVLLKREGWPVSKNLVYRLYRELQLQVQAFIAQARIEALNEAVLHGLARSNEVNPDPV